MAKPFLFFFTTFLLKFVLLRQAEYKNLKKKDYFLLNLYISINI